MEEDKFKQLQKIEEEDAGEDFMLLSGGANYNEDPGKRKVGTPFYLAPEIWEDKPCSKKSDIWSLGVILYELCTFKYPYMANNVEELQAKVMKEKYTPIPVTVKQCFSEIIQKCLQKKPENRPTIDELIKVKAFQEKAQLNKIKLPSELNIEKIQQQQKTVQHAHRPSDLSASGSNNLQSSENNKRLSNIGSVKNSDN